MQCMRHAVLAHTVSCFLQAHSARAEYINILLSGEQLVWPFKLYFILSGE